MKSLSNAWPIALAGLLIGAVALFRLSAYDNVPGETLFVAIVLFVLGLLYGAVGFLKAIAVLRNRDARDRSGIVIPLLTILIATAAWGLTASAIIEAKRTMDKREQYEKENAHQLPVATDSDGRTSSE